MVQNEKQLAGVNSTKNGQPMRLRVLDLPTPPELAKAVKDYCKKHCIWRKKHISWVEEELKLQYHFGGQHVAYLTTDNGLVIVAAGNYESEEFEQQRAVLSAEERRRAVIYPVSPWDMSPSFPSSPV